MAYIDTPILIGDMGNKVVYVNPGGVRVLGKKAPEVVGKDILSLFSRVNREKISQALEEGKKGAHQRLDIEEGEMFFKATLSPITSEDGRAIGFVMGLMDLSREKKLEQSRMDVTARLLSDLRGPLRVIDQSLQAVKATSGCKMECREVLERGVEEVHVAERLVNDLLGLSVPLTEAMEVKKEEFDLARTLRTAIKSMEPILRRTGVTIENLLPHDLPMAVGDREKIGQVLMNLLTFSARMISGKGQDPPGTGSESSLTVSGKVIRQRDGREYILVTVISPDYEQEGMEDALEIVSARQIVKAHSGTITVMGEKGMGTTFSILLPVSP